LGPIRDDLLISPSLKGRLGRPRYMAYTWPIMALTALGMAAAVLGPLHKQAPNIPLLILVGILWFWLWLRLMALRLHDINRSAKWLLVLWLLPAVLAAAGGGQQMIALGGGLFWIVALLLNVVPGSEGESCGSRSNSVEFDVPCLPHTHRSAGSRSAARVPDSLSATACISSSARMISASDILLQRRACSRRAPSQVVRLQSISWGAGSFAGIVVSRSA